MNIPQEVILYTPGAMFLCWLGDGIQGHPEKMRIVKQFFMGNNFLQKQFGSHLLLVKNKCIPQYWGEGISEQQQMVQSRYDWFAPPSANTKKRRRHKDKYRVVPLPLVCTTLCKDKDTCNHKKKTKTKRQTKGQMQRWLTPDIICLHFLWNAILCNSLLMIKTSKIDKCS